jgi:hypothetical protein
MVLEEADARQKEASCVSKQGIPGFSRKLRKAQVPLIRKDFCVVERRFVSSTSHGSWTSGK